MFKLDVNPMFPTPVGMNRKEELRIRSFKNVPHTRGDEPINRTSMGNTTRMFPTPVGMNRGL